MIDKCDQLPTLGQNPQITASNHKYKTHCDQLSTLRQKYKLTQTKTNSVK